MPLMLAIVGASGSGKTLSALLLAEGIKRVQPGPIVVIDTEALRALKHADGNPDRFVHVPFPPPFGPLHNPSASCLFSSIFISKDELGDSKCFSG